MLPIFERLKNRVANVVGLFQWAPPIGQRVIDALRNSNLQQGKKFQVITRTDSSGHQERESNGSIFTINGILQTPINSGPTGFRVAGVTRPTKCPLCHTEGEITRSSDNSWQCKRCDNRWE